MSRSRLDTLFGREHGGGRLALLPYLTAGFPDISATEGLIRRCDALGARVIELGIPYSDSIADGPVIQSSFHRALEGGFRLRDAFDLVERVRPDVSCGLVAMVSYSIVHRVGVETFMARAASVGIDGVILPDLPTEELGAIREIVERDDLALIGLIAPTTSAARRKRIAQTSSGFVYMIARAGLTGEGSKIDAGLARDVATLRKISELPICVGFGVSTADHVRQVCSFADGAIVGSAIVRRITDSIEGGLPHGEIVSRVSDFVAELIEGTTRG